MSQHHEKDPTYPFGRRAADQASRTQRPASTNSAQNELSEQEISSGVLDSLKLVDAEHLSLLGEELTYNQFLKTVIKLFTYR